MISNNDRTACISPESTSDGDVKTVLGTFAMERHMPPSEDEMTLDVDLVPQSNKYYMVFKIDNIGSQCLCVGIQQVGADLEKDSFRYRYGFQLNCRNGDLYRLG